MAASPLDLPWQPPLWVYPGSLPSRFTLAVSPLDLPWQPHSGFTLEAYLWNYHGSLPLDIPWQHTSGFTLAASPLDLPWQPTSGFTLAVSPLDLPWQGLPWQSPFWVYHGSLRMAETLPPPAVHPSISGK